MRQLVIIGVCIALAFGAYFICAFHRKMHSKKKLLEFKPGMRIDHYVSFFGSSYFVRDSDETSSWYRYNFDTIDGEVLVKFFINDGDVCDKIEYHFNLNTKHLADKLKDMYSKDTKYFRVVFDDSSLILTAEK